MVTNVPRCPRAGWTDVIEVGTVVDDVVVLEDVVVVVVVVVGVLVLELDDEVLVVLVLVVDDDDVLVELVFEVLVVVLVRVDDDVVVHAPHCGQTALAFSRVTLSASTAQYLAVPPPRARAFSATGRGAS